MWAFWKNICFQGFWKQKKSARNLEKSGKKSARGHRDDKNSSARRNARCQRRGKERLKTSLGEARLKSRIPILDFQFGISRFGRKFEFGNLSLEFLVWKFKFGILRKSEPVVGVQHAVPSEGAADSRLNSKGERAFRRARFFVAVGLWLCGYGCLLCCVVARSDAKPSCMLCCGVVGLWCVCVCFIGRVGPKKLQKSALFANFYQTRTKMGPQSTTNDTNLGQGGEGATEN